MHIGPKLWSKSTIGYNITFAKCQLFPFSIFHNYIPYIQVNHLHATIYLFSFITYQMSLLPQL
jgi:hypothetical protein